MTAGRRPAPFRSLVSGRWFNHHGPGRTVDQKRKIAKRITHALVEEGGARHEGIIVAFHEVSKKSCASGGELLVDKVK
jgi:4-oxalocrotonate tautomerase